MPVFFDLFRNEPHIIKVSAGQTLFRESDVADGLMYVLINGCADVLCGRLAIEKASPGDIFGELAMIESGPRTVTVVATTDCEFAVIDKKRFNWLVAETPGFAVSVMRIMAHRLRNCEAKLGS